MAYHCIELERDGRVATVTLNRPERRNALNDALLEELRTAAAELGADEGVSVVVIRGAGPHFCAGRDISGGSPARDIAGSEAHIRGIIDSLLALREMPQPVITQVHGACLGLGTQLCIASDITVVAEDARIGVPVFPNDWIPDWWVWRVGASRAKLMAFTVGNSLSGVEAERWGIATLCVPGERLEAETRRLAAWIAKTPLEMLRLKKQVLNQAEDLQGFRAGAERTAAYNAIIAASDAAQAVRAERAEVGLHGLRERYAPPD